MKNVYVLPLLFGFILLSACASSKSMKEEDQKNIQTAKINSQLGIAYLEQHNIQRAKQKLMLAIDEAPNIPEPWYSMAYFFEATGNNHQAREYYQKAIAVAPKRGDAKNNYGTFLCRTGDYTAAIQLFMSAANDHDYLNPADAYENAGLCAMRIPNNKEAMRYFDRALAEDSRRPVSLIKVAQLKYDAGDVQDARERLNQFLAISEPTPQSERLSRLLKQ